MPNEQHESQSWFGDEALTAALEQLDASKVSLHNSKHLVEMSEALLESNPAARRFETELKMRCRTMDMSDREAIIVDHCCRMASLLVSILSQRVAP